MINLIKKYIYILFFLISFCFCDTYKIDENYAASIVKKNLNLSGPVTAQILKGGFSGTHLFTVVSDSKKYVVRFIENKSKAEIEKEIFFMKIAFEKRYGPKIYFADVDKGIVIMEFLFNQKILFEQYKTGDLYIYLAHLLQKIHRGPNSEYSVNMINKIQNYLLMFKDKFKKQNLDNISLKKLEAILNIIANTLAKNTIMAPCHNDLHLDNLIFLGNEFRAIDYELSAQSDPYWDIATVDVFNCFNANSEDILLSTYLDRKPLEIEKAKLYLMKQIVWIRYALSFLKKVPEELCKYEKLEVPAYEVFLRDMDNSQACLEKNGYKLKFAKVMINKVIENFESPEFDNAIKILSE